MGQFTQFYLTNDSDSTFMPKQIKEWCISTYKYYYSIDIDNKTKLLVATTQKRIPDTSQMVKIIKGFRESFPKSNLGVTITYLPTPFKKIWNGIDNLTSKHVNSGYSTIRNTNNEIVIFRKEESYKVLIHELIHALHLHCVYDSTIRGDYNGKPDESIVETWAIIVNCLRFKASTQGRLRISKKSSDYEKLFRGEIFKKELDFSLKQAAKLLRAHECTITNDIGVCYKTWNKIPATFYYYIVKAAFLCDPNRFVSEFSWNKIQKCRTIPFNIINSYLQHPVFIAGIKQHFNKKHNDSMRMSKYGDYW
tara:strand:- start:3692 stop:4612 length:921 start_codon:yes stop_codon:yes gene_type:complete